MNELLLASSPATSTAKLTELAAHSSVEVRARVAANPSVSLSAAMDLCEAFPEQFLQNPSLPLWRMEDPALLLRLKRGAAVALIVCPLATLELLEALADHSIPVVRLAVASSSLVTGELLERMVLGKFDQNLLQSIAANPRTPPRVLEQLAAQDHLSQALGKNPSTPAYLIHDMALATGYRRIGAALSVHLPPERFVSLQRDSDVQVRVALAFNPRAPIALLKRLARDESAEVRLAVARNPRTPLITLFYLREDTNSQVRKASESARP